MTPPGLPPNPAPEDMEATMDIKHKLINGQPYSTLEGLIELTRYILHADPTNKKARAFLAWVKSKDGHPSDEEFMEWAKRHGVVMRGVRDEE